MRIEEVTNKAAEDEFLDVARLIYKNDPNWVCPLDKDIRGVFTPEENPFWKHGEAIRWLLYADDNKPIGRIAAFIDHNALKDGDQPTGGCGFFECKNDQEAANLLFDTAKKWLESKDIEAMDGPINFGETDRYWGLLVDGFTSPAYRIAYNPPYYQQLFENYGFQLYYRQEGFHLDLNKDIPPRFWKIAEWVAKKPDYHFEHFDWKQIDRHVNDFTTVFNEAWKDFKEDFEPLDPKYVKGFLSKAKVVIEPRMIWLGYNKGEPIAIYLMYPDVNQIFKGFKGKLNFINKLKLLYKVKTKQMTRARGVLMGVVPKFQGMGVESAFIWHLNQALKEMPQYNELEFSWVGDFNPPMRKLWMSVGAEPAKHYITYRYLFDRTKEFKRYPLPEEEPKKKEAVAS